MKTTNLLFTTILFATFSFVLAQAPVPTLNSNHIPATGDVFVYSNVNLSGNNPFPGDSGASVTWDFSNLTLSGTTTTWSFADPTTVKYYGNYYNANPSNPPTLASSDGNLQYEYYRFDNNTFTMVGYCDEYLEPGQINDALVVYSDNVIKFKYPMKYLDFITDSFKSTFSDGIIQDATQAGTTYTVYDSYGTLKLPGNKTYQNVMRFEFYRSYVETSAFGPKNIVQAEYFWYDTQHKQPLLWYHFNKHKKEFAYVFSSGPTVSINTVDINNNSFLTYPNPFTDNIVITINNKEKTSISIELLNSLGQVVYSIEEKEYAAGMFSEVLDFNIFSKGIYLLKINRNDVIQSRVIVKK